MHLENNSPDSHQGMLRETTWGLLDSKSVFYIKSVSERTYVPSLQYKVSLALTTQSCFHHLHVYFRNLL